MRSFDTLGRTSFKKGTKPFVTKASYHKFSVTYMVTSRNMLKRSAAVLPRLA